MQNPKDQLREEVERGYWYHTKPKKERDIIKQKLIDLITNKETSIYSRDNSTFIWMSASKSNIISITSIEEDRFYISIAGTHGYIRFEYLINRIPYFCFFRVLPKHITLLLGVAHRKMYDAFNVYLKNNSDQILPEHFVDMEME